MPVTESHVREIISQNLTQLLHKCLDLKNLVIPRVPDHSLLTGAVPLLLKHVVVDTFLKN